MVGFLSVAGALIGFLIVDVIVALISYKLSGLFIKNDFIQIPITGLAPFLLFISLVKKDDFAEDEQFLKVAAAINIIVIAVITCLFIYNAVLESKSKKEIQEKTITQDDLENKK